MKDESWKLKAQGLRLKAKVKVGGSAFRGSGLSPAAGRRRGYFDRKRIFGLACGDKKANIE